MSQRYKIDICIREIFDGESGGNQETVGKVYAHRFCFLRVASIAKLKWKDAARQQGIYVT